MKALTHSLFACLFCIFLYGTALPGVATNKTLILLSGVVALVLGSLPDLDMKVPLRLIDHRSGLSHSLFTVVAVSLLVYLVTLRVPPLDLIMVPATAAAIASHVLLDTLTFSGCPLLWPFTRHRFSIRLCRYDNTLVNVTISALSLLGIAAYIVYI